MKLQGTAVYHCMSRIVSGDRRLDVQAKEVLRKMMREVADFSGVELLAYCLMNNHFHILVRVPEKTPEALSRAELLRRYRVLYENSNTPGYPDAEGLSLIFEGSDEALAEQWVARLSARMQDVSEFIRTLKQRFSLWYNRSHKHFGAVWAEKFKSVLVEDSPDTLKTVAAYLDLNPVRAKLVEDPADYRWCSYAEAMGGDARAGEGLAQAVGCKDWSAAAPHYRVVLFGKGGVARRRDQGTIPSERVREIMKNGGKVEACELLQCRIRYFSDGAILGSEGFVRRVAAKFTPAPRTPPPNKPSEGTVFPTKKRLGRLRLMEGIELFAWRDLQVGSITESPSQNAEISTLENTQALS